ncbi:tumor necrosis factor receptor superfamily member 11B-like [Denticeps clupeoides]|uniref:tumor necrosis factor receptor superfamily member 11B-like n=1 Tax=Denticeps clupeoides TaxID=299321 RepID=UPI0010A3E771|nr:tumor necrosis factor receptor superfamily member 11B-like [Denticeps clupeoides]
MASDVRTGCGAFIIMRLLVTLAASSATTPTYRHRDPESGLELTCSRCPPGSRLLQHCTAARDTRCAPCGAGLYTEFWNYVSECLVCDLCYENQVQRRPCSPAANSECECGEGFYWSTFYCRRQRACPPGHGVKAAGTPYKDVECEPCPDGFYVSPNQTTCHKHTDCKSIGQWRILKGTRWHDNICTTCKDLQKKDGLDLLRAFLPAFFLHPHMNVNKVQRLVKHVLKFSGIQRSAKLPLNELIEFIARWGNQAEAKEFKNLPEQLRRVNLHGAAKNLELKMAKIQNEVKRCSNVVKRHVSGSHSQYMLSI